MGSDLFEVDHRHPGLFEVKDEMELPLRGLGVVNQPDPVEVGIADIDGAWQIGCTHAAKAQDDPRGIVGDLKGARNALGYPPVGGDPKERRTVVSEVCRNIDDVIRDLRFGFGSRG